MTDGVPAAAFDALAKTCGEAHVWPGTADDAVDGVPAGAVVAPASTHEVHEVLIVGREHRLRVGVRGGRTKLGWGAPPHALDLLLDTTRMSDVLEHAAGDLVVRVQPGVPLAALQARLAPARQQLALDPPEDGATVGGVVAANASGPARLLFGTVRDLLIGVTLVLADGTVARAGGKVVKNVAGYDLGKLFTGSLGTLGVLTETIFRLHPVPTARRVVTVAVPTAERAGELVGALLRSPLVPTAAELDWPHPDAPGTLTVLFEGIEAGAQAQADTAAALLGGEVAGDVLPPGWGARPWTADGVGLKVTAEIAALPQVLHAVRRAAVEHGPLTAAVRSSPGVGVTNVGLPAGAPAADLAGVVTALRTAVARGDGSVVVLAALPAVKSLVDVWGHVEGLELMRRIKDRFDPEHRLSPGRFVGGI